VKTIFIKKGDRLNYQRAESEYASSIPQINSDLKFWATPQQIDRTDDRLEYRAVPEGLISLLRKYRIGFTAV
jgi:hypothetical protein